MVKKMTVAVLFGGKAPEHEVSIITGIQVLKALSESKYEILPVYVSKEGRWILGDETFFDPKTFENQQKAMAGKKEVRLEMGGFLVEQTRGMSLFKRIFVQKVDVFFPAFHGRYGEDGSIQGLFEMNEVAYVGCDVAASAVGMDKVVSKAVASSIGIPVMVDYWLYKYQWQGHESEEMEKMVKKLRFPMFVKPARLGSSIGLKRVENKGELKEAVGVAFFYDTKVVVEQGLRNAKEVNISLTGNGPYEFSATEMPVSVGQILSFEDKYISREGKASKGMATAKRMIPAPIKKATEKRVREYATAFFSEIGGSGMARIDFLVSKDEKQVCFNEINTMPGSVAFYLWKKVGVDFASLVEGMIESALLKREEKKKLTTTFKSNILAGFGGAKGVKKF